MINDVDIKKLKKTFATKDDLNDLRKEMRNSFGKLIEMVVDGTNRILEKLDDKNDEIKGKNGEIRTHRIQIGEHENRLQKVEHKVFPRG